MSDTRCGYLDISPAPANLIIHERRSPAGESVCGGFHNYWNFYISPVEWLEVALLLARHENGEINASGSARLFVHSYVRSFFLPFCIDDRLFEPRSCLIKARGFPYSNVIDSGAYVRGIFSPSRLFSRVPARQRIMPVINSMRRETL